MGTLVGKAVGSLFKCLYFSQAIDLIQNKHIWYNSCNWWRPWLLSEGLKTVLSLRWIIEKFLPWESFKTNTPGLCYLFTIQHFATIPINFSPPEQNPYFVLLTLKDVLNLYAATAVQQVCSLYRREGIHHGNQKDYGAWHSSQDDSKRLQHVQCSISSVRRWSMIYIIVRAALAKKL